MKRFLATQHDPLEVRHHDRLFRRLTKERPGRGYEGRNPAYLLGGVEHDCPQGKVIHWGEPIAVLYAKDPKFRISYPDFVWDDGLYITEPQKTTARVHAVPGALLHSFWAQRNAPPTSNKGMWRDQK